MRRGLISWSRVELPEAVLDARVAAAQIALAEDGLDALVVLTNPARTAGVSYLTGFVPYWNEGLLVVPASGRPSLVSALSNRVVDWIQRNAHVASVQSNPRIGIEAGAIIARASGQARIGVVDLPRLPVTVTEALASGGHVLVDASDLMARLRTPADPAEIALAARAASIAHAALGGIEAGETDAARAVAALDGTARRLGAEEVYPAVAVDLSRSTGLARLEGTAVLGDLAAVRASVAYKGVWVRLTRTLARDPAQAGRLDAVAARFAAAVAHLPDTSELARFSAWVVEGCRTTVPLEPWAGSALVDPLPVAPGALVSVQATVEQDGVPIVIGAPVLIGGKGHASSLLAL